MTLGENTGFAVFANESKTDRVATQATLWKANWREISSNDAMNSGEETERDPNRWSRCAVVVGVLAAISLALANVPGRPAFRPSLAMQGKYGPQFHIMCSHVAHGYPFDVLRHGGVVTSNWASGLRTSNFRVGANPDIRPWAILCNISILLLISYLLAWCVDRHLRLHGWRIRLIHLLALILIGAVIASKLSRRHRAHIAQLNQQGNQLAISSYQYQQFMFFADRLGPDWLRHMTGDRLWEWGDLVRNWTVNHTDEIPEIPGKSSIQVLVVSAVNCDAMPSLADFDNLIAINLSLANWHTSAAEETAMPCLREIAKCKTIQGLNLLDSCVTDAGLQEIARLPHLKVLQLSDTYVTDEGLRHLETMNSLQELELYCTKVTEAGVRRLRSALPGCRIKWDEFVHLQNPSSPRSE